MSDGREAQKPAAISHELLDISGVLHGFFTRIGGVSTGLYRGLNIGLGSEDDPKSIAENRRRAMQSFGLEADAMMSLYQVHGKSVIHVREPYSGDPAHRPRADGMVTDRPGIALGIATADCAPILFADPDAGVIGACHAGWRGACDGVIAATVEKMTALGAVPGRIAAVLGPCIHQESYEVGPEFEARLVQADPQNAAFFAPSRRPGHYFFDLPGYVLSRMAAAGLKIIGHSAADTYSDPARFFSYRRATHRDERGASGAIDYGRLLSAIALTD